MKIHVLFFLFSLLIFPAKAQESKTVPLMTFKVGLNVLSSYGVDYRIYDKAKSFFLQPAISGGVLIKDWFYIGLMDHLENADLILKIIDRIHISDPVNEKAFELKVKILLTQGNDNFAKYCHETFSKTFEEFYGQTYQKSFEEIVSLVSK